MGSNPMTQNNNQSPDGDEVSKLLAELDKLGPEEEETGDAEGHTPDFPDTDEGKKAAHAFAEQRRLLRAAREVIKTKVNAPAPAQPKPVTDLPPPNTGGGMDSTQKAQVVLMQLQMEAMTNVGIADVNHPIVQMEVQRLYTERVASIRRKNEAEQQAPEIIEEVLGGFDVLLPEDKEAVKQRLASLSPEARVNKSIIRAVAQQYIGENFTKFSGKGGDEGQDGATHRSTPPAGQSPAGAAAASGVKARGSAVPRGGGTPPAVKPPTPEEAKRMRSIGLDPLEAADVAKFREALQRAGAYTKA